MLGWVELWLSWACDNFHFQIEFVCQITESDFFPPVILPPISSTISGINTTIIFSMAYSNRKLFKTRTQNFLYRQELKALKVSKLNVSSNNNIVVVGLNVEED